MTMNNINFPDFVDQYHLTIDNLIRLNITFRQQSEKFRNELSPTNFSKLYCTVQANIGRSTGSTSYFLRNMTEGALLISYDLVDCETFSKNANGGIVVNGNSNTLISSLKAIEKPTLIFIDRPSKISEKNMSIIYNVLSSKEILQVFILLGG